MEVNAEFKQELKELLEVEFERRGFDEFVDLEMLSPDEVLAKSIGALTSNDLLNVLRLTQIVSLQEARDYSMNLGVAKWKNRDWLETQVKYEMILRASVDRGREKVIEHIALAYLNKIQEDEREAGIRDKVSKLIE